MSSHPIRLTEDFQALLEILGRASDLSGAASVLGWDQETYMPPGAAPGRADQLATISRLAHETFTQPRVGELLARLADACQHLPPDSFEASLVRVTRREYQRRIKVPPALAEELARARSVGPHEWAQARKANDFSRFAPHLRRNIRLARELADCLGYPAHPYDALLDEYEPDLTVAEVRQLFAQLKDGLLPLLQAIRSRPPLDDGVLRGDFDERRQEELSVVVLRAFGYDFQRGRLDRSAHPMTICSGPGDVRLTTRYDPRYLGESLFSTIHEAGHGLYDQGIPDEFRRTPLFGGASMGVHESQSRLWENVVGRSREFWTFLLPRAGELFPEAFARAEVEEVYRAVNRVEPGEIRVDADEVTYNLHILLRFELELELLEGHLDVDDLPEAWNTRMERYLGVRPRNDARGVLQDIHWAQVDFGYFPTYTLGNVLAVQFFEQALRENPGIPQALAQGEFRPLLGWLREHIHRHGAKFTPGELVRRVTGGPMQVTPYLNYLRRKYGELYELGD